MGVDLFSKFCGPQIGNLLWGRIAEGRKCDDQVTPVHFQCCKRNRLEA